MKIGFDAKRAFLNQAGLGNYSRNTLIALKKFFPENDYVLFTPEIGDAVFPEQSLFNVVSPDSPASRIFKSLWRSFSLSGILDKHEIDLYHGLTNELPSGIHKTGVKTAVTIHDLIFLRYPRYYKTIDRNIYLEKLRYAVKVADQIIAISQQTRNDLIEFLEVDPVRIKVVYQGISDRFFSAQKIDFSMVKRKYKLPDQFILSVGTIEFRKNQLNILKGMISAGLTIPVVLVGKPTQYAIKVTEYAIKNGLEDKVFILDQVTDEEIPVLYRQAMLMVYVSEFEGFGLPVIEAMAMGCPVLTSNVSCLPETGSDAAIYCNPSDPEEIGQSMSRILNESKLTDTLSVNGKNRALLFSGENASLALLEVYKNLFIHDGRYS